MNHNQFSIFVISLILLMSCNLVETESEKSNLKLWYNQPANASLPDDPNGWKDDPEWLKALPLGNGSL
ncbi:MAG TPA: hypothetical protein VLQ91_14105, partial [Draconibacterium sp.]|nr:hypothetical protein [Draconibacterium sp.]